VHGRPGRILDAGAAAGVEESGRNEIVEGGLEEVQRRRPSAGVRRGVVGGRERCVEEAWLRAGELDV
jgi:hypothetical protein